MILLDTNALLWFAQDVSHLGRDAIAAVDAARSRDELYVSAITFWEVAMLVAKRRLHLDDPRDFRQTVLLERAKEVPVSGEIGITAGELSDLHGDPADRIIAATAMVFGATLMTADRRLLAWRGELKTQDARL